MGRTSRSQRLAAWLCGAGLLLVVLGYRGMRYVPMTPEEETQEQSLREFIPAVSQLPTDVPAEVREQIEKTVSDASVYALRSPPYRQEAAVALCLGTGALFAGLIVWFRCTTRSERGRWVHNNDDA